MATNSTPFCHFPLFASDDKPSVLTDWNNTMNSIDQILAEHSGEIDAVSQIARGFNDQVQAIRREVNDLYPRIEGDETTINQISADLNTLREQILTLGAKVKDHTIAIDDLEIAVQALQNATADINSIRTTAENAGVNASKALQNTIDMRDNFEVSSMANKLFIPLANITGQEFIVGHRVNEDTHDDQPVEGAIYKAKQPHSGNWNSDHFERVTGYLKKELFRDRNNRNDLLEHVMSLSVNEDMFIPNAHTPDGSNLLELIPGKTPNYGNEFLTDGVGYVDSYNQPFQIKVEKHTDSDTNYVQKYYGGNLVLSGGSDVRAVVATGVQYGSYYFNKTISMGKAHISGDEFDPYDIFSNQYAVGRDIEGLYEAPSFLELALSTYGLQSTLSKVPYGNVSSGDHTERITVKATYYTEDEIKSGYTGAGTQATVAETLDILSPLKLDIPTKIVTGNSNRRSSKYLMYVSVTVMGLVNPTIDTDCGLNIVGRFAQNINM